MERARRPAARRKAIERLGTLAPEEREALLIKCWMSHDARWFMAAAMTFGIEAANRLNQAAAREEGKVEARRLARALELPPVKTAEDYLLAQEAIIGLLGPDLLDYEAGPIEEGAFEVRVKRCFAQENVARAGILDR